MNRRPSRRERCIRIIKQLDSGSWHSGPAQFGHQHGFDVFTGEALEMFVDRYWIQYRVMRRSAARSRADYARRNAA